MSDARCACGAQLGVIRLAVLDTNKREVVICPACWSKLRPTDQIASKARR